jgi:hypothetical protein
MIATIVLSALAIALPGHRIVPQCVTVSPGDTVGWYQWDNGPRFVPIAKEDCAAATAFTYARVPANIYGIYGLLNVVADYEFARHPIYDPVIAARYALHDLPRVVRLLVKSPTVASQIVERAQEISAGTLATG